MSRQTRRPRMTVTEQLELRVLPTVNVAFNPNSGLLKVKGDNGDNFVEIEGKGTPGHLEVFVDGVSVGEFNNVRSIKANLKGGNDDLLLAAIQIEGSVNAKLGSGADQFDIDSSAGSLTAPVIIGGSVVANLGNNAGDNLDFDDNIQIYGDAIFSGVADVDMNGDGTSAIPEIDDDILFFSDLTIRFSGHGDSNSDNLELDLDNVGVGGRVTLDGSNEAERVEMTNCFFSDEFNANLDDGNDVIDIDNGAANANFFRQANFRGGDDNDTLLLGIDNLFEAPAQITDFETIV